LVFNPSEVFCVFVRGHFGIAIDMLSTIGGVIQMKIVASTLLILLLSLTQAGISQAIAGEDNIETMAQIMLKLNHYPSDTEKETLRQITLSSTSSKDEKTMANAMINLEHSATAEDKKKLSAIVKDDSASEDVRTLAQIIHDVNHKPSAEDKKKLENLK
jgi:hypothetical protein